MLGTIRFVRLRLYFLPDPEHIVRPVQKCMDVAWEGVKSGQMSPSQEHCLVRGQWRRSGMKLL